MANPEQVIMLCKRDGGVELWNKWRIKNLNVEINLSEIRLYKFNLERINLENVNLKNADLSYANLFNVNLKNASLENAILCEVQLNFANLYNAYCRNANLEFSDLHRANLRNTNFENARFNYAKLNPANVKNARLSSANFYRANLEHANFENTDLSNALLRVVKALGTSFKDAILTGACIEDWHINNETSFEGVVCEYIYLKWDQEKQEPTERRPSDPNRNFAPGEFAKLIQKTSETVDLIFSEGIDWQAFLTSYQNVQLASDHGELDIRAIEKSPDGSFIIRVEVPSGSDKAKIERIFFQKYKKILTAKAKEYQKSLQSKDKKIQNQQEEIIKLHREKNTDLMKIIELQAQAQLQQTIYIEAKAMSESYNSKYDQRHSQNQFVDTAQSGSTQYFTQNIEQKQDLQTAAKEIQTLLDQLSEQYGDDEDILAAKIVKTAKTPDSNLHKLLMSLQAGSVAALEQFLNHPAASFVISFLDTWHQEQLNG